MKGTKQFVLVNDARDENDNVVRSIEFAVVFSNFVHVGGGTEIVNSPTRIPFEVAIAGV